MKILFCDNSLHGQLNFRGDIIKEYASLGYQVVLVSPPDKEYTWCIPNIKYVPIKLNRSSRNPFHDFFFMLELYRIYKKEKPDYIFHYSIKPNIYGTFAAYLCGIPSTCMITGLGYVFSKNNLSCMLAKGLYKTALSLSKFVLVLNSGNKEVLLKRKMVVPQKLIHLVGGEGVDLKQFVPSCGMQENDKITFLMISRPLYEKGYNEYIEAAKNIKVKYSNVEFCLLGAIDVAYPNHVPLEVVSRDHNANTINYLGFALDVAPIIQKASCIVLPSYNEGLSRSLMEAIAMGKPVITTDISGCKETVEDGKNGYLVLPKDANSLKNAFEKFIHLSNEERIEMGRYSRLKAEREFDIKKVIEVYKSITDTILK